MKLTAMQKLALSTLASDFGGSSLNQELAIDMREGNNVPLQRMEANMAYSLTEKLNTLISGKLNTSTWALHPGSIVYKLSNETLKKLSWWHNNFKGENEIVLFVSLGFHIQDQKVITKENYFVTIDKKNITDCFIPVGCMHVEDEPVVPNHLFKLESLGYEE